jgi:hypothetical protein
VSFSLWITSRTVDMIKYLMTLFFSFAPSIITAKGNLRVHIACVPTFDDSTAEVLNDPRNPLMDL